MSKKWLPGGIKLLPFFFLAALVLALEGLVRVTAVPPYILPAPSAVLEALVTDRLLILRHGLYTLSAVVAGLGLALSVSLPLALAMDRHPALKETIYPLLVVSQAIPIFALAPLMLVWFGVGLSPKIFIVALVCFFPLAVNLVEGLARVDRELIDLLQTMRARPWLVFRAVRLPASLPYFFSGLKIAATYSVLGAIIGEWLGGRAGLGIYMLRAYHAYRLNHLFASIIVVVVLSLLLFKLAETAASLAMPWHEGEENDNHISRKPLLP